MNEYDYREDLIACQSLDEYFNQLECDLDMEKAASWKMLHRDKLYILFINDNGEIRVVGAPYINKVFNKN